MSHKNRSNFDNRNQFKQADNQPTDPQKDKLHDEEEVTDTHATSDQEDENRTEPGHDEESLTTKHDREQWDDLNRQLEEEKDKYLRLMAEFDNYRKRTVREKAEIMRNGSENAIVAILPILDDLERAIEIDHPTDEVKAMQSGIEIIYNKFLKTLGEQGLKQIDTDNRPFDTDYHEAIAIVPAPDEDKSGKILDCVQKGYILNDKVIRHAKVVVAQS